MILFWMTIALASTVEHTIENTVVGIWSEFGCAKDQLILKSNDKVTLRLWAGEEYGWLQEYHFWSIDGNVLTMRERRGKNSPVIEQWTIERFDKNGVHIKRGPVSEDSMEKYTPRTVQLTRCP